MILASKTDISSFYLAKHVEAEKFDSFLLQGAKLTEYTLRLIGSDIEHCIRKMLHNGEIRYNMKAKVLNFSVGKHRFISNYYQLPNVQ